MITILEIEQCNPKGYKSLLDLHASWQNQVFNKQDPQHTLLAGLGEMGWCTLQKDSPYNLDLGVAKSP